jgi:imidazole glycerol phosphate synthase glutamine amidotransferase subunit
MIRDVCILSSGVANIASMAACLKRLGCTVSYAETAQDIADAPALAVPGVGTFGVAMQTLTDRGWTDALRARILSGQKILMICLGMQILCAGSDESPGVAGLGVIDATVKKLNTQKLPVPQMGWNLMSPEKDYVYFANSYALPAVGLESLQADDGWQLSTFAYGDDAAYPYVAMLRRQGVMACQFHPELSGKAGEGLISQWLEGASC